MRTRFVRLYARDYSRLWARDGGNFPRLGEKRRSMTARGGFNFLVSHNQV